MQKLSFNYSISTALLQLSVYWIYTGIKQLHGEEMKPLQHTPKNLNHQKSDKNQLTRFVYSTFLKACDTQTKEVNYIQ